MYHSISPSFAKSWPILQRAMFETAGSVFPLVSSRKRPNAPRSLTASAGTGQSLVSWIPPQSNSDIAGWRVYRDNENSLYATISDPKTTQIEVTLPSAGGSSMVYVSAINKAGLESTKVPIKVVSDSNQYVITGTAGGTGGTIGELPPGYLEELQSLVNYVY